MDENCLFCKFASGEIKPQVVYEDEKCIVFMDKFPLTRGQTLIVGKIHETYIFDLDNDTYTHCMLIAKKIVKATDEAFGNERCWLIIQGLEVPHNHIKILPMYKGKHIPIEEGTEKEASDEELKDLAEMIKSKLKE